MSQSFPDIASTETIVDSRQQLLDRDEALRSLFAGTAFPASATVGQLCLRTDQGKLYICTNATGPVFEEFIEYLTSILSQAIPVAAISASANMMSFLASSDYATMRTNLSVYSTAQTDAALAALVDSSPTTLDTLNELAAALGDDPNFATTMTTALGNKLNSSSYTAADVLSKLLTVDGASSGIDADLVDGQHGSYYLDLGNATGSLALGRVPDNLLTYAKLQDVSATSRILGRISAGAGDIEELSINNVLNMLSTTRGVIAFRGASSWSALSPSAGWLKSAGAGSDPAWTAITQADVSGLTTGDSPQFTAINVGHATDTTITRLAAGCIAVEGKPVLRANSGSAANSGLVSWGTAAPGTLAEGEVYLRHA